MIVKCRVPVLIEDTNEIKLANCDYRTVELRQYKGIVMSVDGSTTCTGISLIDKETGKLIVSMALIREKTGATKENRVQYKVKLKRVLTEMFMRNPNIVRVFYEEPLIKFAESAEALLMLRTSVQEIIAENEPQLNYINYKEVNNKLWKKLLLHPDKCPVGTELEKKAVKEKILESLPYMSECTQDELDSYGMGYVAVTQINNGEEESIYSKKKYPKFGYHIEFIGSDTDDEFVMLMDEMIRTGGVKIPDKLIEHGIRLKEIGRHGKFEEYIFNTMAGDDVLLVLKFSSNHHGNIVLKYRIGHLSVGYKYIYAIIWRKSRKN